MDSRMELGKKKKREKCPKEKTPCLWEQLKSAMAHIGGEHSFYLPEENQPFFSISPALFYLENSSPSLPQLDTSSDVFVRKESSSSSLKASTSPGICTKPSSPRPVQCHPTSSTTSPHHTQSRVGKQIEKRYFPDLSPESTSNSDSDSDVESVTVFEDDVMLDSPRRVFSRKSYNNIVCSKIEEDAQHYATKSHRGVYHRTSKSESETVRRNNPPSYNVEKPAVDTEFLDLFKALNKPNISKTRRDSCAHDQNRRPKKCQASRDPVKTTQQNKEKHALPDISDLPVQEFSKLFPSPGHRHSRSSHKPTQLNHRPYHSTTFTSSSHGHQSQQQPHNHHGQTVRSEPRGTKNSLTQNKDHSLKGRKSYSLMPGRQLYYQ